MSDGQSADTAFTPQQLLSLPGMGLRLPWLVGGGDGGRQGSGCLAGHVPGVYLYYTRSQLGSTFSVFQVSSHSVQPR